MLKKLDKVQVEYIYNNYMTADFPEDELKPLFHIKWMMDEGVCSAYALFSEDVMLSYFFLCEDSGFVLVDYLAVNPAKRGEGIGSKTLDLLKEIAKDKVILVECEDTDFALCEEEKLKRKRRISFYRRAGFMLSTIKTKLFGVRYVILAYPDNVQGMVEGFQSVYYRMLGKDLYHKHLEVYN